MVFDAGGRAALVWFLPQTVRPAINFEIHLPATGWNGKFLMLGCGGFSMNRWKPGPGRRDGSRPPARYAVW